MKTLISNAMIIPMKQEGEVFYGDIGLEGIHISFVGEKPAGFKPDKTIDASGMIAMPALINAHTHLSMQYMRNYKDDAPNLQAWLAEIFPIEDKLTQADVLTASRLGVIESIQSGIATFNDMYFFPEATARAVNEGGIRANLGLTLFGDLESTRLRIKEREKLTSTAIAASNCRITLDIAPHAIYTCTKETYQYGHDWAKANHRNLHTHLSETKTEVDDCLKEHRMTPLHYLHSIGALKDIRSVLAHCVHLSSSEIALMKDLNASVVHNPSSNCKLASGVAPISTFMDNNLNVAIGSDGSSSNNNQNLFEEMHIASLLSSVFSGTLGNLKPFEVLKLATINGAKALGLDARIGTLEAGKEADILLLDSNKAHLTPLNDPFSALVYGAQASDVDTLFCQGKMVMEKRKVLGFDQQEIQRDVNKSWEAIRFR
ncbi:MAG TPA: amidohydrolase [Spirochaetales bacterium]|jgi:5-methylthioadenosine/S-adenosylhomocysteine deaminase|nr:amidohydrolase [Spirochaetales bacterium]